MSQANLYPFNPIPEQDVTTITAEQINSVGFGCKVYLNTDALVMFKNNVLPFVTVPFVLITGCSDLSCQDNPTNRAIAEHSLVKKWFAQNLELVHPKVIPMPIAIDYHL